MRFTTIVSAELHPTARLLYEVMCSLHIPKTGYSWDRALRSQDASAGTQAADALKVGSGSEAMLIRNTDAPAGGEAEGIGDAPGMIEGP